MKFDYSKLLGKLKEKGLTQAVFAEKIGTTPATLSLKLSNVYNFKQKEISMACDLLEISKAEIGSIFFAHLV